MIVLDTNLISELLLPQPNVDVTVWLASQPLESVFTTAITQAEVLFGIRILPMEKRQLSLEMTTKAIFLEDMAGRILPFEAAAADIYASVVAKRKAMGRPMSQFDAQIAAITLSHGAALATRNVRDFAHIGLDVIDPWQFRG
jgi:predicted nucleic acid-binding protein